MISYCKNNKLVVSFLDIWKGKLIFLRLISSTLVGTGCFVFLIISIVLHTMIELEWIFLQISSQEYIFFFFFLFHVLAGTDSYDSSSKGRIPSWTDRILFRSNDKSGHPLASSAIRCEEYSSCSEIKTSDHRAVTATLLIDVDGTSDSIPKTSENSSVCLIL